MENYTRSYSRLLFDKYVNYREKSLRRLYTPPATIAELIQQLRQHPFFYVEKAGESVEGRPIWAVKVGKGERNILIWSQMHGDEPTATGAIFDILNFLSSTDELNDFRNLILDNLSLWFIPMLNPDGAERNIRENALGIDLNRDAQRLQAPESQILKTYRDKLQAEFGFNLHDQNRNYGVCNTGNPATFCVLSPAFDESKSVNETRRKAMKVISYMNKILQNYIPQHISRYNDSYEPRAFGDNIQKWGTSAILVESGGFPNDFERIFVRKLNYVAILEGLYAIASGRFEHESEDSYFSIPINEKNFYDFIVRNAILVVKGKEFIVDVAFNKSHPALADLKQPYPSSEIVVIGDCSTFFGYEELDATGMKIIPGKILRKTLPNLLEVRKFWIDWLREGYTTIKVKDINYKQIDKYALDIIEVKSKQKNDFFTQHKANFFLEQNNELIFAFLNGKQFDIKEIRKK
jgi:hypothetical protein